MHGVCAAALISASAYAQENTATDDTSEDEELMVLETIVVTGSSIRGVKVTGSDVITLDRSAIEASGVTTTSDLLAQIPQNNDFNTLPAGSSTFGAVTDVPNLRNIGLGGTSTLTILNGRRMVGAGILQTIAEPSVIPPLALERVEVMADGASAIYGSDPIAGVINLITRRDYDGVEMTGRYGMADSYEEWNAGLVAGTTWDRGSALIAYDFNYHGNLSGADRDFITSDHTVEGGADERSTSCPDANIGAGGFEIIPGYFFGDISFAAPGFAPNTQNQCDTTDWIDVYGKEERHSVFASARHELSDRIEGYVEGYYSQRQTDVRQAQEAFDFTMPITNPYFIDPTGTGQTAVRVSYRFNDEFGDSVVDESRLWSSGVTAGAVVDLGRGWELDAYGNFGWGHTKVTEPGINQIAAYTAALFGFTPDTALDPFGGQTNPAVIAAIGDYENVAEADQSLRAFNVKADGTLAALPGGDMRLAVGAKTHHESIDASIVNGPVGAPTYISEGDGDRTINSLFAELYIPVFGDDNARTGFRSLELSLMARYDHYSELGSTTNPKFGVSWEPFSGLSFRGSWSTSFHAPSLADADEQTVDARIQVVSALPSILTPPGMGELSALIIAGGNPDLKPEEASTWTLGMDIEPESIDGLNISLTYYNIDFTNGLALALDGTGRIYTIPALAQFYSLNPSAEEVQSWTDQLPLDGVITSPVELIIDARRQNLQGQLREGLEFDVSYIAEISDGVLHLGATGDYLLKSSIQAAAGEDYISNRDSQVRFRTRGKAIWSTDTFRVGAFINYTGSATYTAVDPVEKIEDYVTVDLNVGYTFGEDGPLGGFELMLNLDNVFDTDPPYLNGNNGYVNGNPLGRVFSVGLRKRW
jgi:iron complex outermembrane receptor protein